jgi:hypothetical protein
MKGVVPRVGSNIVRKISAEYMNYQLVDGKPKDIIKRWHGAEALIADSEVMVA